MTWQLRTSLLNGFVRVFPAWPAEMDASFDDLRAQGGFLVTAEQRGGVYDAIHERCSWVRMLV